MKLRLAYIHRALWMGTLLFSGSTLFAQKAQRRDAAQQTVIAGPQYKRSSVHNFLWGKHYRKEWSTPVTIRNFYLDTARGGLIPYETGGSRQTTSLKLHDGRDREYVLRSLDKRYSAALPELYRNTFIESLTNDQVSIAHPYGALIVAPLAEAAGVYHTNPTDVYLPKQKTLGKFNNTHGNKLYLFEQRPDENWRSADNPGNASNIIGTDKLFEKLHEDNTIAVDQREFVKARLFDMLIGDWSRHEDQWKWAQVENENGTIYKPIPRDRDHAFTKFDGTLLKFVSAAAGVSHIQSFAPTISNIRSYNYSARNLDRVMTNHATRSQWMIAAQELQRDLPDSVIENAVRQMPKEVFPISGEEITAKLKSRRDHLQEYAKGYYEFIAKEVDVTGTAGNEYFEISDDASGNLSLKAYALDGNGSKGRIFYERSFPLGETKELRVYGLGGNDKYDINLAGKSKTVVRVIGARKNDEYNVASDHKLHIYDAPGDTAARYKYEAFKYNKKGFSPSLYYGKQHIIYVGAAFKKVRYKWGKSPYASMHEMYLHYSPTQNALRTGYEGIVNNFVGRWNLLLNANYDWVKVINFFGVGNDAKKSTDDRNFYRLRSESGYMSAGLSHNIGQQGNFVISPFFQTVKLLNDPERFLIKDYLRGTVNNQYFDTKKFLGVSAGLKLQKVDNEVLPTKGVRFTTSAAYTKNISDPKQSYSIGSDLHVYLPLSNHFVLSVKNGAANISGEPEFYQLNPIGGRRLRGYRRERFWGNTAYYNNNELQYLFNFRSFLFNGKMGFFAFADQGRVWVKEEKSDTWHYGYGGGLILSPFNKIYVAASYGISPENKGIIHLELRRALK
ncbi:MAG: hypothetical protein JNK79_04560 [Chitinophagaceae bacterium]|nr:hypothetical protein [Chitinophagaceae bacterium]